LLDQAVAARPFGDDILRAFRGQARFKAGDVAGAIEDLEAGLSDIDNPTFWQDLADRGLAYGSGWPPPSRREDFEALLAQAREAAAKLPANQLPGEATATEQFKTPPLPAPVAAEPPLDNGAQNPVAPATESVAGPAAGNQPTKRPVAAEPRERRVALVIGNAAYRHVTALPNPTADAELIATALRSAGFDEVMVALDQDRASLVRTLRAFGEKADGADWGLVYFAGHGIEIGGQNYLIPVDAALTRERDVTDEAIAVDRVIASIEGTKNLRMVVLDACRDNPFAARMVRTDASRSVSRGLARIEPDVSTLVLFAAREGTTAADGHGRNSPFAEAFARRMTERDVELGLALRRLSADVLRATGRKQEPVAYGRLPEGELYFIRTDN
jgi:hypothetical protein